ncbi:DNA-binding transcriptional LysR family regulator [Primorskyibacter sedentarius]|uniref:DNA-binding transcriptional LysR family regulator n=1 Tax=Primorskyibacter sedentarius TaxID=745311 RepID=A0A4R3IP30_9RHOB|nr:LysR family transcriptional regulator [Primorskyibacter sedentarius]TCS50806.1 DNA-binding transcriptional LysR family regulator [Primorskyibacter sedentarius]
MLNATWLETFVTLTETGHFTRAAERLNMTQPGVSQHLRKLEEQLGQSLIAQEGKSFTLTPAGEAVRDLGLSRRIEERHLRDTIMADDPDVGEVRIACSGSFAQLLYPRLLALIRDAPRLLIHLEAAPQDTVVSGVLDGEFDLGIVGYDTGHPRLNAQPIGREELCLILPSDAADEAVTFASLDERGFVAHPDGFAYADDLFSLNFPEAFAGADRMKVRTFVNQIGQIPAPVAEGIGYTLLPRSGVEAFSRRNRLKIVTLPQRRYHELWSVTRRTPEPTARLRTIMRIARDVASEIG